MAQVRAASLARIAALALLWGSNFLWISVALRGLSPVQLTFARLALGALVLLPLIWARGERLPTDRATWAHLTVAAVLANAAPYLLFAIGEQHVDSSVAGILNATTPLWTLVVALAVGTEQRPRPLRIAGLALGFAGAIVIFAPWQSTTSAAIGGALACLAAAASYGLSYVYMSRYLAGRTSPVVLSAAQLTAAAAILALALPIGGRQPVHLRADAIAATAVLGLLGTGAAYVLNYRIITDDGPTNASTVTYLLPVVAVILGAAVLAEPLTATRAIGTVVILAGVALTRRSPAPPAPR